MLYKRLMDRNESTTLKSLSPREPILTLNYNPDRSVTRENPIETQPGIWEVQEFCLKREIGKDRFGIYLIHFRGPSYRQFDISLVHFHMTCR